MMSQLFQNLIKKATVTVLTAILFSSTASYATETVYKPFSKGSFKKIQQDNKDGPYIVAFWSVTCAYCMKELALFGTLMDKYPAVKLITITTDAFLEDDSVKQLLAKKNLVGTETWVFADNFVERLYFDINPRWRGELPLTYFFDKDNVMMKHMGVVKEGELVEWLEQQSARPLQPSINTNPQDQHLETSVPF